jgi:hypothetical protein
MRSVLRRTILVPPLSAAFVFAALVSAGPASTRAAGVTCPSAIVHHEPNARLGSLSGGRWIQANPKSSTLIGYLFGAHETGGRLAVYTGVSPTNYTDQKILWILDSKAHAGARLHVRGVQLAFGPDGVRPLKRVRFHQSFGPAGSDATSALLFPSDLHVPRAGCWRLSLRTGHVSATVTVLAEPGACPASRVDGNLVHAGVITGGIDPETDVVDGRFRLHVGELRDVASQTFQKILWYAPANRRLGGQLVVRGRRIFGPKGTFVQKFNRAYAVPDDATRAFYPSTIIPPSAGCWRLTLTTGKLRNALVARVDG